MRFGIWEGRALRAEGRSEMKRDPTEIESTSHTAILDGLPYPCESLKSPVESGLRLVGPIRTSKILG